MDAIEEKAKWKKWLAYLPVAILVIAVILYFVPPVRFVLLDYWFALRYYISRPFVSPSEEGPKEFQSPDLLQGVWKADYTILYEKGGGEEIGPVDPFELSSGGEAYFEFRGSQFRLCNKDPGQAMITCSPPRNFTVIEDKIMAEDISFNWWERLGGGTGDLALIMETAEGDLLIGTIPTDQRLPPKNIPKIIE